MNNVIPEKTASETRYELAVTQLAQDRLSRWPEMQAETIARHYTAQSISALNLLRMIHARRGSNNPSELEDCIALVVRQIKSAHKSDFGIELEWNSEK